MRRAAPRPTLARDTWGPLGTDRSTHPAHLAFLVRDRVAVRVRVLVTVRLRVLVTVALRVRLRVAVALRLRVPLCVAVRLRVRVAVALRVRVRLRVAVGVRERVVTGSGGVYVHETVASPATSQPPYTPSSTYTERCASAATVTLEAVPQSPLSSLPARQPKAAAPVGQP